MENLKKLLTFLMLGVFLLSFVYALEIQSLEKVGYDWDNVDQFTIDETTSKYGKYEIRNAILGLSWFQYGQVIDLELINNSDVCGEGCFADIPITLYQDGILVDEVTFETSQEDGSWIYQPIRSYQFSYQGEIQNYKTECREVGQDKNGTTIQECNQVEDETHIGKINYQEGEVVKSGTYLLRLDGNKKPSRTVDWKIKTNGIWTNEWAIWGNISEGDDAEVILNSPEDESTSLTSVVNFNASANVTGGADLINMSLWTNETGDWEVRNNSNFVVEGIVYDNFTGTNGDSPNSLKWEWRGTPNIQSNTMEIATINDNEYIVTKNSFSLVSDFEVSVKADNINFVDGVRGGGLTICDFKTTSLNAPWDNAITNCYSIFTKEGGTQIVIDVGTSTTLLDSSASGSDPLWHKINYSSSEDKIYFWKSSDGISWSSPYDEIWNSSVGKEIYVYIGRTGTGASQTWRYDDVRVSSQRSIKTQLFERIITESTLWNFQACDTDGDCGFATLNRTVHLDTESPQIEIEFPVGTLDYNFIGNNETLNVTFTDINLESCWYDYNGTNISIDGCLTGFKNSTEFILETDNLNMTLYANDTVGNLNSTFINWSYNLLEKELTYSTNITEGELNVISIKVIISEGSSITDSILAYNGDNLTTSTIFDGENYTIISNNAAPIVDEDRNITFNFFISVDGIEYETNSNNQTVVNQNFGICGGISNDTLLNMSLFDEETLEELVGDIEFNAKIISKSSGDTIGTSNTTFSDVHFGAICFSPIESYPLYFLDAEIRYFKDGYATEFYNIQKADLGDYPNNLSLFSLNENDSTEFSVTYKNNNFIFTEGVIIQLQRKYIGEDIYRTVESPITGDGGKTILHIDLNTNKYRISVVKDGELLDFFENIVFSCDNELAGDCRHSLDGTVSPNNDIPIEDLTDFTYSVSIDEENQTVTVLFTVPSGTSSSVNVLLKQIDMFGNLTSCDTTIITSAGSIACDYVDTIEKSILELHISKNDVELVVLSFVNDPELDMDGMNFFIVFLFMISLVGMAISSPEWMIIISVMVLIISGTMLLLSGTSLVMGLGAIAWVIIAAAIIILKMAKQEDR